MQDMQSGQGGACGKVKGKSRPGYMWKKWDEASKTHRESVQGARLQGWILYGYMTYKGYTIYEDTTLQVSTHYCNLLQGWYGTHYSVTKKLSSGYRVGNQQSDCLRH